MSAIEGIRRIEKLGTGIALWGSLAGLLLWCVFFFIRSRMGLNVGLMELLYLVAVPICTGVTLRIVGWVVEGFLATPPS